MSDNGSDTSETIVAPAKPRKAFRPQRRMSSPTLVPSGQPDATDPIIELLQQAAAGKKIQPKDAAPAAQDLPAAQDASAAQDLPAPQDLPEQDLPAQDLPAMQDLPEVPGADLAPDDRSLDALSLLQELAHKELARKDSGDNQKPQTPAAPPDATPPPSPAVADITQLDLGVRDPAPQPATRANAGRKASWLASAALSAILASGVTGLVLLGGIPALNKPPAESAAIPAVPVRPQAPPAQTATAECDPAGLKDPFGQYVFAPPNVFIGKARPMAEMSPTDYGWYSLMSAKARLERHRGGGAC